MIRARGMLPVLTILGLCTSVVVPNEEMCSWALTRELTGGAWRDRFGGSVAISGDGSKMIVGALQQKSYSSTRGFGYVQIFSLPEGAEFGRIMHNAERGDNFGTDVAISDDGLTVVVGAPGTDKRGLVRTYRHDGNGWIQLGNDLIGSVWGSFGFSVDVSADGKTVAVGEIFKSFSNPGNGIVHVFRLDEGDQKWNQLGNTITGEAEWDRFGFSVSLSGDGQTLVAGAPYNGNGYAGKVQVYSFVNDWTPLGQAIVGDPGSNAGYSVALSADATTLAVGFPFGNRVGVYRFDGTQWNQVGGFLTGDTDKHFLGASVALSDDGGRVAVGSPGQFLSDISSVSGYAMVFELQKFSWEPVGAKVPGVARGDRIGISIDISGDGTSFAVGADRYDANGQDATGHVRLYGLNCVEPTTLAPSDAYSGEGSSPSATDTPTDAFPIEPPSSSTRSLWYFLSGYLPIIPLVFLVLT